MVYLVGQAQVCCSEIPLGSVRVTLQGSLACRLSDTCINKLWCLVPLCVLYSLRGASSAPMVVPLSHLGPGWISHYAALLTGKRPGDPMSTRAAILTCAIVFLCRDAGGITNLVGVLQQGIGDLGVEVVTAILKSLLVLTVDDESQGAVTTAGGLPNIVKLLSGGDDVSPPSTPFLYQIPSPYAHDLQRGLGVLSTPVLVGVAAHCDREVAMLKR